MARFTRVATAVLLLILSLLFTKIHFESVVFEAENNPCHLYNRPIGYMIITAASYLAYIVMFAIGLDSIATALNE